VRSAKSNTFVFTMVRGANKNIRNKKRTKRKKGKNTNRRSDTRPIGFPFPSTSRVHLRYVDVVPLVSTVGAMAKFSYYTNGLYDPQVSVGGHQPMGWDQGIGYYNNAVVLKSRITVNFAWNNTAATALAPVIVGIEKHATGTSGLYTDWTSYRESGYPTRELAVLAVRPVSVKESFDHMQYLKEDPRGSLAETANFATGNPVRTAIYTFFIQSVDKATTSGSVQATVVIDYDVEFSSPKQIAAS